jgi:hypothetical protein
MRRDDDIDRIGAGVVQPLDQHRDRVFGQLSGVLTDRRQVDVGESSHRTVVEPDHRDSPRDLDAGADQGVDQPDRAAVVECLDRCGQPARLQQNLRDPGTGELRLTARQNLNVFRKAVTAHGGPIGLSPEGGDRAPVAVDEGDAPVAEGGEVCHRLFQTKIVRGSDHVDSGSRRRMTTTGN